MNVTADVRFLPHLQFKQLDTRFDPENGAYWAMMQPRPRPCFSSQLLSELRAFIDGIVNSQGRLDHKGEECPVGYAVLASKIPGVFNLGGDLALFRGAIESSNRDVLQRYASQCIDDLYPWNRNFDLPVTTISLVQGDALGGGFEAALGARCWLPRNRLAWAFRRSCSTCSPAWGV